VSTEKLNLILGCFGRVDDGFVSCNGIENNILVLDSLLYHFNDIMDFCDTYKLFDRKMMEYNSVRHFIFNMQNRFDQVSRKLWTEQRFLLYQKFTIDHKSCGLFLRLDFADD
jgi:hypothetical protein